MSVVGLVAAHFVAALPPLVERLSWCHALAAHAPPTALGLGALAALGAMVVSLCTAVRRLRLPVPDGQPLLVLPEPAPVAYAVPGRPGQVVVSAGLLRALDPGERRVLLAHERSHLARNHHRYLRTSVIAAAVSPVLRQLSERVRFATERWADEDAAEEVGDRRLVARAITRAALVGTGAPAATLGATGSRVPARVDALLNEARPGPARQLMQGDGLTARIVGLTALLVQSHHVGTALSHICPA